MWQEKTRLETNMICTFVLINFREKIMQFTRKMSHLFSVWETAETQGQAYRSSSPTEAPTWESLAWKKQFISREQSSKSCWCNLRKGKGHWCGKEAQARVTASAPRPQTAVKGCLATLVPFVYSQFRVSARWHFPRMCFPPLVFLRSGSCLRSFRNQRHPRTPDGLPWNAEPCG